MKITILNGNPDASNNDFETGIRSLSESIESSNHTVTCFTLRDMDIRYCVGCFGCWGKTPGECSIAADDSVRVCRAVINSDLMIFASPVIMGFTSALLKKMHDRLIPLLLPYIGIYQGEQHHDPRYDSYPLMGVLIQPEQDTDEEDISIIKEIYERDAINFHSKVVLFRQTTDPTQEVVDEINRL